MKLIVFICAVAACSQAYPTIESEFSKVKNAAHFIDWGRTRLEKLKSMNKIIHLISENMNVDVRSVVGERPDTGKYEIKFLNETVYPGGFDFNVWINARVDNIATVTGTINNKEFNEIALIRVFFTNMNIALRGELGVDENNNAVLLGVNIESVKYDDIKVKITSKENRILEKAFEDHIKHKYIKEVMNDFQYNFKEEYNKNFSG